MQVNGKLRARLVVRVDAGEADVKSKAMLLEASRDTWTAKPCAKQSTSPANY